MKTVSIKNIIEQDITVKAVPNEELPVSMRMSRTAVYGNMVKAVVHDRKQR